MISKYRVHEVAKDFGYQSKVVVDLLAKYFDEPKKHMTALEEEELDIIFETFTKENEVESFDAYFAMAEERPKKEKKAQEEKPQEEEKTEPEKADAEKPAAAKAKTSAGEKKKPAEKPA
ncbi:MAG: translation initiation factor IF-2 N-terminal domain-containing protein, partial [Clostridia bacterium]|nr:translation initiation factor IF-2 N-terminal domain-containing protein [Clostridia bacterium]